MKKLIYPIIATLLILMACAAPKKVTDSSKTLLQEEFKTMMAKNQKYRGLMEWGTLRQEKVDSIQSLPLNALRSYLMAPEFNLSPSQEDSLKALQTSLDETNIDKLMSLVKKYGWLSQEKLDLNFSPSRLLLTSPTSKFDGLRALLLKEVLKGRMPGLDFAKFVDNLLLKKGQKQLYGTINELNRLTGKFGDPLIDNLDATNAARKEIGLGILEKYRFD